MLTYSLRERFFNFREGRTPIYPADATVNIALEPLVQFGGVAGVTRNAIPGGILKARANLSTGRFRLEWDNPLFDPVEVSFSIADTTFQIRHNIVTVSSRCTSQQDFTDLVATVYYALPAVLNVYLVDVPFPTHAWGTVGDSRFRWDFRPSTLSAMTVVTTKRNQEDLITNSWRLIASITDSRRMIGGLHYFHVACRLLEAGYNRFEFAGEALLNFAKSLQATFGESRDAIRAELEKLKFTHSEIEGKFLPALVLRNEFDVGHASLAILSNEQLRVLHEYANLAENAFRDLYKRLFERLTAATYALPSEAAPVLSSKKEAILRRLAKNIEPFEPLLAAPGGSGSKQ